MSICLHMGRIGMSLLSGRTTIHSPTSSPQPIWMLPRQRWVAQLASYNFALEYQKGKDNTVADFLSRLDDRFPTGEVQDYLNKIPYPGVKAVLDNAIMPLTDRAEQGVRPNPNNQKAGQEVTIGGRPARLATTNITDWKLEQQEDPVLYQVVKHRKAS